jgi:hypothetical protein
MSEQEPAPLNQEQDPRYNTEPGLAIIPGSSYQKEMAKWEQFPDSKWALGQPGNAYVYRPFPKMLYKAERRNGKIACMEAAPDRYEYKDDRAFQFAEEAARRFTDKCQLTVHNDVEMSRAMEIGYRESPKEAEEFIAAKERGESKEIAHRNYDDRNMSENAKAEIAKAQDAVGEPLAEIPEARRVRTKRG